MKDIRYSEKAYEDLELIFREKIRHAENEKWRTGILLRLLMAIVCCQLLLGVIFGIAVIKGSSMEPSYNSGDIVIFCRVDRNYTQGDVVLIRSGIAKEDYIKRIVALPGQTIDIKAGLVSVDGELLRESYIAGMTEKKNGLRFPLALGENEYFVLGDNRENSIDSRSYGPVEAGDIDGKVIAMLRIKKKKVVE